MNNMVKSEKERGGVAAREKIMRYAKKISNLDLSIPLMDGECNSVKIN